MFALNMASSINTFFWLLVLATMVAMMGRFIKIPYALALVMTGLVVGATGLLPQVELDPHVLFAILLPPLLFEAAINMQVSLLVANWKPVSIYALFGTILSSLFTAWATHHFLGLPVEAALVFGVLISPTDPISVIAIFREMGVGKNLSMIMEAESAFNDGVAIVLFTLLVSFAAGHDTTLLKGVGSFFVVAAGGAALGGAIGLAASHVTREFDDHLLEIMLSTVVVFGSYLSAEWLHVSGVIAVVVAGLVVGSYGMQKGMSPTTRLAVNSFWEYAAFAVNSLVFLLVGFEVSLVNIWPMLPTILTACFIVLIGRAISIYGLSPVVNLSGYKIPFKWQHILLWGGLRGAIPMALALSLERSFPRREEILLLTFGVVMVSLLFQGLSIKPLLKRLGLTTIRSWWIEHNLLASQIMASRDAMKELDLLESRKAISFESYQRLHSEYQQRLEDLENKILELNQQDDGLIKLQENYALRQVLLAEKSSLREAYRSGFIGEEDWQSLSLQINEHLDTLDKATRE